MIKNVLLLMLVACSACGQTKTNHSKSTEKITDTTTYTINKSVAAALIIDAGRGVGHVKLNSDAALAIEAFGQPDKQDAAMGAAMMTWYTNHDTTANLLTIYSRRNMGGKDEPVSRVKLIRITSPEFKTVDSLHTGLPLTAIQKAYHVRPAPSPVNKGYTLYDDLRAGIAFEMDQQDKCISIIVHQPGDRQVYHLNMKP